MVKDYILSVAG